MQSILSALRHPLRSLRKCTDSRTIAFVHLIGRPGTAELCQSASCVCRTTPWPAAISTRAKSQTLNERWLYSGIRYPSWMVNPVCEVCEAKAARVEYVGDCPEEKPTIKDSGERMQ